MSSRRETQKARLENLEKVVTALQDSINALQDNINTLQNKNTALQDNINILQNKNTVLQDDIDTLRNENIMLQNRVKALEDDNAQLMIEKRELQKAMLGNEDALHKIQRRVLLDQARDSLAQRCGYRDWNRWYRARGSTHESRMEEAKKALKGPTVPERWQVVGQNDGALLLLLCCNHIRDDGNYVAHNASKEAIYRSIDALKSSEDRRNMYIIYNALITLGFVLCAGH